jgi:hypothetical protein
MKDLYWKVLQHLDQYDDVSDVNEHSDRIESARQKIKQMGPLELLEVISDVMEKEHPK